MKPIRVTTGIIPLGEFKTKASSLINELKKDSSTLIITQNGRPAAVVLAPQEYDRLREEHRYLEAVALGLADAVSGKVVDHRKVIAWLATWGTGKETEPPL